MLFSTQVSCHLMRKLLKILKCLLGCYLIFFLSCNSSPFITRCGSIPTLRHFWNLHSAQSALVFKSITQFLCPPWHFVGSFFRTVRRKNARQEKHEAAPPKCLWVLARSVKWTMVFFYKNCSDLLWEKIVLVIEKNFWNSRLKAENLQKFRDH